MSAANYALCFSKVLNVEGGYVNNPHDPGGTTNMGVTQRVLDAWRQARGQSYLPVKDLAVDMVQQIFKVQYWDAVRADDVWAGMDYLLFDEAVHSGPVQSIKDVQQALGVKVDGHLGLLTLQALRGVKDRAALIEKVCALRLSFLHRLKTWRWFGKGWGNRVNTVESAALLMARA